MQKKIENTPLILDEKSIAFFLDTFGSNSKTLIRAVDALLLRLHLSPSPNQSLSLQTIRQLLSDLILEEERNVLTPDKIIRTVAEYYGIRMEDILSKSQSRECALPRQIAMYICREELHLPFVKIGDLFTRDHSTVMASVKQIEKALEDKKSELAAPLSSILKRLDRLP